MQTYEDPQATPDAAAAYITPTGDVPVAMCHLWTSTAYKKQQKMNPKDRHIQSSHASEHTPFFVPEQLLEAPGRNEQTQSWLFRLPIELLLLIIEKLKVSYFQVVFGLTCKAAASLLCERREVLAPWRGFRDKEGLYRLLVRQPKLAGPIQDLSGQPLLPYIPLNLRLCRACWRHLPRSEQWWLGRMSKKEFDKPHVNWFDVLNFFAESQRNCGQHKCPECCVKNYVCFMSEREYERALAEDRQDESKYYIDLDTEGGRRVCLGLPQRLAKP